MEKSIFLILIVIFMSSCYQKENRFLIVWDRHFSNYPNRFCQIIGEDTLYGLYGSYVIFNYQDHFMRVDTAIVSIFKEHIANGPIYSNLYTGIAIVESTGKIQEGDPIYEEKYEIGDYSWSINDPYFIKKKIYNKKQSKTTIIPFEFQFGEQYQRLLDYIQTNNWNVKCSEEERFNSKWITPEPTFETFHSYDG